MSTGGAVIVGCAGLYFHASQMGKRMDDLTRRFERFEDRFQKLEDEFRAFKELVNSKFAALDTEIARLMDRGPP